MPDLGHDEEERARAESGPVPGSRLSRRQVFTASAIAAGAGLTSVSACSSTGADFNNPSSFKDGTPVARYDMTLQDILTVIATNTGLPTLTGDMLQTLAHALSGPLSGQTFGRNGSRLRFFATGLGHKTDDAPTAQLEIAGNWSVE